MDRKEFQEKVLKEYPRMKASDVFKFRCHPGISCYNKCCNDVNIFLTPYDIIRLKRRLGISSSEFLAKYAILPIEENLKHPVVMLKMDEKTLDCPFVGEKGCSVYEDRPWSCRMFPVGSASPDEKSEEKEEFYFLLKEDVCKGFEEDKEWTVAEWLENQRTREYEEIGEEFKKISLHPKMVSGQVKEPVKLEMFYTVCYDIDKFRDLVYNSTFFKRFKADEELKEKMKTDDVELLKYGFKFLRFSLFGERALELTEDYQKIFEKRVN